MNVLLVYPRFRYPSTTGAYHPLGILYIAAVARQSGHQVKYIDLTFETSLSSVAKEAVDAEVVAVSATTPLWEAALTVLKLARQVNPSLTTIIGGPHATMNPTQVLADGFDIAVLGEGEETVVELLNALEKGESLEHVAGIAFKSEGKPFYTQPRLPMADLDGIVFPARDLINSSYDIAYSIITSRGCPYNCKFCQPAQRRIFGSKVRARSPRNVVDEVEILTDRYPMQIRRRGITFVDDTFTANKSWVLSFCRELRERNIRVKWICNSRVNLADEQMFEAMREAGCTTICFGVESGSQKILDSLGKGTTVEQAKKAFDICHRFGISAFASLMIGSPGETRQDIEETINLVKQIRPGGIAVSRTTPTPGSLLYEICREANVLNVSNSSGYDYYNNPMPIKLEHLSAEDLVLYENRIKNAWLLSGSKMSWLIKAVRRPRKVLPSIVRLLRWG